ncbi:uncharacterized protein L201_001531 [Kwoniella dendrophila CBS 6074]|uniref:Cytochrome P450 n=1 Tax=Kwoniella dendrophila CBS 6074 TaxID=1295534 RepID=A0AAX4JMN9_9TREE
MIRLGRIMRNNGSFTDFFDKSSETLGPICQIKLGPFAHMVVITDYLEIENLLLRRHQSLDRSSYTVNLFKGILPKALLTLKTDEIWRHHRKLLSTTMTPKFLRTVNPNITRSAEELVKLWQEKSKLANGRSFEAELDLESATMDAICGIALGENWNIISGYTSKLSHCTEYSSRDAVIEDGKRNEIRFRLEAPELAESVWYIFNTVPLQNPFPSLTHYFISLSPTYKKHIKRIENFLKQKIREARSKASRFSPNVAEDMANNTLDLVIAKELGNDHKISDEEIKQELFQYLLAGTETSSTTLAWWCKYMTNNPSVQRKLRDHLQDKIPDYKEQGLNYDNLSPSNVPYLEAVVHETLRIARTAGGYLRDTKEDVIILGHYIPKGTTLAFPTSTGYQDNDSSYSNENQQDNRDRRVGYWQSGTGHLFDPERWLDEEGQFNATAGPSLPFSLGQRRCFGKNLALLELRVFIAHLNLAFFFAPIPQNLNGFERFDKIISHPKDCFIRPVSWDSEEVNL